MYVRCSIFVFSFRGTCWLKCSHKRVRKRSCLRSFLRKSSTITGNERQHLIKPQPFVSTVCAIERSTPPTSRAASDQHNHTLASRVRCTGGLIRRLVIKHSISVEERSHCWHIGGCCTAHDRLHRWHYLAGRHSKWTSAHRQQTHTDKMLECCFVQRAVGYSSTYTCTGTGASAGLHACTDCRGDIEYWNTRA